MSIWTYGPRTRDLSRKDVESEKCLYCGMPLIIVPPEIQLPCEHRLLPEQELGPTAIRTCEACGWWAASRSVFGLQYAHEWGTRYYGAMGTLKELDLSDITQPLQEVRDFLLVKYEQRFSMSPRLFEETVASVFSDLGYRTRVTAYSGDGGIDVILDGPGEGPVGVQVKRYRNSIEVEQIRALLGALVLKGYTQGIFITTSRFRSGAAEAAASAEHRGYSVELIDAPRFYEALRIARRESYSRADDPSTPFSGTKLFHIEYVPKGLHVPGT